jgi:hypothetical protein
MGTTTISPLLPFDLSVALPGLQYVLLSLLGIFCFNLDQMDCRHNHRLERSLIHLLQGCSPDYIAATSAEVTTHIAWAIQSSIPFSVPVPPCGSKTLQRHSPGMKGWNFVKTINAVIRGINKTGQYVYNMKTQKWKVLSRETTMFMIP